MTNSDVTAVEPWWKAIGELSGLVLNDGLDLQDEAQVRRLLTGQGYARQDIDEALAWVERATLSGSLMESLAMLQPQRTGERVANPSEVLGVNPDLWMVIDRCRRRGLITAELAERLLEGVRHMDTADWEEAEVEEFIGNVLTATNSTLAGHRLTKLLAMSPHKFCH